MKQKKIWQVLKTLDLFVESFELSELEKSQIEEIKRFCKNIYGKESQFQRFFTHLKIKDPVLYDELWDDFRASQEAKKNENPATN